MKRWQRAAIGAGIALALWLALGAWTAWSSTRPAPSRVEERSEIHGRATVEIELTAPDGVRTVAWFVDAKSERCAVLLSGIRANRTASLPRAAFWLERGWSVLLPDLRGTGESDPEVISFGWNERLDVVACVAWLRARGVRTVALHGQSLGAAAAVYAVADRADVELLVLDACYDTAKAGFARRLPWVPLPGLAFLPVRAFLELRIGVSPAFLNPVNLLPGIMTPTFLAAGSDDPTLGNAPRAMLEASAAQHKRLVLVAGARHEELWLRDPEGLARALAEFLVESGLE